MARRSSAELAAAAFGGLFWVEVAPRRALNLSPGMKEVRGAAAEPPMTAEEVAEVEAAGEVSPLDSDLAPNRAPKVEEAAEVLVEAELEADGSLLRFIFSRILLVFALKGKKDS